MNGGGKRIIVSPLNWGLGHATRCIPIIKSLIKTGFEPVLAGDGSSLKLLTSEFPALRFYELPSYGIRYSSSAGLFSLKLLSQAPRIQKAVVKEHKEVEKIIAKESPSGIISDNRFGVWSRKVPSVYITHQLSVKAGFLTKPASYLHQRMITKFDRCWVCDFPGEGSLAGELSSQVRNLSRVDWIGPLSRFSPVVEEPEKKIDVCVVLSGPEPLRSQFEKKVIEEVKGQEKSVVLIRGVIESSQKSRKEENVTIYNFMLGEELETTLRKSRIVVMRSGYSSIMDLQVLGSKALLVPTPGQSEQEYLAERMEEKGIFSSVRQADFKWESLERVENLRKAKTKKTSKTIDYATLFDVFQKGD